MSPRRSFVASGHGSKEEAEAAVAELERLDGEHLLDLADAAVVVRTETGRVELHQRHELSAGEGAVAGGVAGVLAGILIGFPIAAPIAGLALGGGLGAIDTGIDDKRMRRLGESLEPGQAAACALVGRADWPAVRARMAPHTGELLVVELTLEAEEALRAAAEGAPPASGGA